MFSLRVSVLTCSALISGVLGVAAQDARKPAGAAKPSAPLAAPPSRAPAAATAPVANQPSGTQNHYLEGSWNVYWYGLNKVTLMNIAQASGNAGITTFMGALGTLEKEACSTFGTVIDSAEAHYQDGPAAKSINITAYVIIRVQCKKSQIWIEAFGLPSGKVLMSGRATLIDAAGQRSYAPIALGR